jgi:hypothetical protein
MLETEVIDRIVNFCKENDLPLPEVYFKSRLKCLVAARDSVTVSYNININDLERTLEIYLEINSL